MVVRGKSSKRKTTTFWHLCVQWKDGTTTWERLSDVKESHKIHIADYSLVKVIRHEPAFNFWVTNMHNKREAIISALKGTVSRVTNKNIKFGIRVPQTVIEALRLGKNN